MRKREKFKCQKCNVSTMIYIDELALKIDSTTIPKPLIMCTKCCNKVNWKNGQNILCRQCSDFDECSGNINKKFKSWLKSRGGV